MQKGVYQIEFICVCEGQQGSRKSQIAFITYLTNNFIGLRGFLSSAFAFLVIIRTTLIYTAKA